MKKQLMQIIAIPGLLTAEEMEIAQSLVRAGEFELAYEGVITQGYERDAELTLPEVEYIYDFGIRHGLDVSRGGTWLADTKARSIRNGLR
ncbi:MULTISPECIES: hypothetical protein [unclassified Rathayibacter]|uniref:hypothetical protein n=1 Tax=unclassified Rathayibacter TaxID=2609250 RepID=UPI000F474A0C|nr:MULTISPECIES: hypothetical protein [unclassified Rathayibacter]